MSPPKLKPDERSGRFRGLLLDMDGTLIRSIEVIERVWMAWAARHGLDPEATVRSNHGSTLQDAMRRVCPPGLDPKVEAERIWQGEWDAAAEVEPMPGAVAFVASLPEAQRCLVTSADERMMRRRLEATGFVRFRHEVFAEQVSRPKPDPEPYLLGAKRLGLDPKDCLAFEDAPLGILSAKAAGCTVIGVAGTFDPGRLDTPDVVTDFRSLRLLEAGEDGRLWVAWRPVSRGAS